MKDFLLSEIKVLNPKDYNLIKASLLQKLIRRSMEGEACFVATLYANDNQLKGLKRRLLIIASEDVGFSNLDAVKIVNDSNNREELIQATAILARSWKNREADNFLLFSTRMPKQYQILDPETKKEVENFILLIKAISPWYMDRSKQKLKQLEKYIEDHIKKQPEEKHQILKILFENYKMLTRNNVHGARCLIALFSLISSRSLPKNFPQIDTTTPYKMSHFDKVFDFAVDMHTPQGKQLKRGTDHWIKEGCVLSPEWINPASIDNLQQIRYPLGLFLK